MRSWLCLPLVGCVANADVVASYVPDHYEPVDVRRAVYLGDGITKGAGASDTSLRYASLLHTNHQLWTGFEQDTLPTIFPSIEETYDLSRSLALSKSVVESQLPSLDEQLPAFVEGQTVVMLTMGADDLVFRLGAGDSRTEVFDELETRLHEVADFFDNDERFPDGVLLYVSELFDPTDAAAQSNDCGTAAQSRLASTGFHRVNRLITDVAIQREFAAVDAYAHFLGHGLFGEDDGAPYYDAEDPTVWMDDCFYPNDRGHHELRRLFVSTILGEELEPIEP